MRRVLILAVVAVVVLGAFVVAFSHGVAADGTETGVFPNRTFEITRSPPGGPRSDTYTTSINPTESGRWSVQLNQLAGAALIVQVYRIDGSIPVLEGSSKLRDLGASSTPVTLFAGMSYEAQFTPYGKAGTSVLTERFVANVPPTACFTYSPASPIAGQTITFDASCSSDSDGQIVAYAWDFGDGSNATGVSATHAYAAAGTYSVSLRVTDDLQAYDTHIEPITVAPKPENQPPTAAFAFSPASPLVGQLVSFDGSGSQDPDGVIVDYTWNWGDGSSESTGTNFMATHAYAAAGTYTVLLTVTDDGGLTATASHSLRVLAPPVASFIFSPSAPLVGDTVSFDASASSDADGTIVAWDWDFGDGTTGTGETTTHAYTAAGAYPVKLTVTDNDGLTGSQTQIVTVSVQVHPPTAAFTFSPAAPLVGQTVTFDASTSSDPDNNIASYAWDFGDGTSGSGVIATHAYAAAGTFSVTLTVTDTTSLSDSVTHAVRVLAPPVASFIYSPAAPLVGDTVSFDASGSSDADGTITAYAWDFGDSTSGSGVTATHVYGVAGPYTVVLTVTDNDGLTGTTSKIVAVGLQPIPPTAAFTFSPAKPLVGATVTFDGSTSSDPDDAINSYAWNFGDGSSGSGVSAGHAYAAFGTYTVTLTVTDQSGLTGAVSHDVKVYAAPVASFIFSPSAPLVNELITFDGAASSDPDGTIASYAWDFGDGASASGSTATHAFSAAGTFQVTLTVTDSDGFTGFETKAVAVGLPPQPPVALFTFSPAKPLVGATVTFDGSGSYDPDGTIASYAWTFGDGATASIAKPTHAYAAAGTYQVTLTVTDATSLTNSVTHAVQVYTGPTAAFTFAPASPVVGDTVTFDGSTSSDPDGTISSYAWLFGDGASGNGATATHAYAAFGTFTATLTVTDSNGFTASVSHAVTVLARPTASFTFSPAKPLVGATVTFDASASSDPDGTIASYAWAFGDGATGAGKTTSHAYAAFGTFTVTLTVTDSSGLTATASTPVRIYALPVASFTFSPAKPLAGASVSFDASTSSDPDGTIASWAWTFGDSGTGTGVTATHTYAAFGTYTVQLTVTDADGFTASTSQSVKIYATPTAAFTFSPAKPLFGSTVSFDGSGSSDPDGTIASYAWTFGDSATGTGVSPTHVYAAFGTYTVTLTVTDSDGFTGSVSHSVKVYAAPTAAFTFSPAKPLAGAAVSFDGSTSSDPDGTIASYAWNFGDSGTGTGQTASHTYAAFGTYTITLTVTDSDGFTASTSQSLKIYAAPTASFTYSPAKPLFGTTVSFDASTSSDPDGTIASYAWNFGDSATGTGIAATHIYAAFGTYTAQLTVTDSDGFTGSVSHSVKVYAAPTAAFTFSPAKPLVGATVSFDASTSSDPDGTIASYAWNFGDSATGSGLAPTHTYAAFGAYTVTLTVTDSDGFTASVSHSVQVYAGPTASFTFSPAKPLAGAAVSFDASGSSDPDGTIASYAWNFGDSSTGSGVTATHTYAAFGTYTITLTVTDSNGFSASTSQSVKIYAAPTAAFTFSPANPTAGSAVSFDASGSSDPDGTIASYAWDFGDGSTGTGVSPSHTFASAATYHVTLTVTDNDGFTAAVAHDVVVSGGGPKPAGEDWVFSDFFNVPYGEWWDIRQFYGLLGDTPLGADCFSQAGIDDFWCSPTGTRTAVAAYPYSNWVKTPVGDNMIFAPYRFTADVRQNPAFDVEKPVMLPTCTDLAAAAAGVGITVSCPTTLPTGGSLSIDEHVGYLTNARATELATAGCPDLTYLNDGYIGELQATITMDSTAALKLFGVTNPSTQWANGTADTSLIKAGCGTGLLLDPSSGTIEKGLKVWYEAQGASGGPYDIQSAFGAPSQVFSVEAWASYDSISGKSTLHLDMTAWGFETLFARWAYWGATTYASGLTGAAPTGWWGMEQPWTEDLRFVGDFGATTFNASVSGVIQDHFRASAEAGPDGLWGTADDVAKWIWQPVLGDKYPGTPLHPGSELGATTVGTFYVGQTYIHTTPGSSRYGQPYSYDYVPAVWALKAGETQTFKFPTTPVVLYDPFASPKSNDPRALVAITAGIVLGSSLPATGVGTYDLATNTLTVIGPITIGTYPTVPSGKPAEGRPLYSLVHA